jgi:hypothetical protein
MSPVPRKWAGVVTVAAIVGVTASLLILAFPFSQTPTGQISINGKNYSFESESLFGNAPWLNYSYRGVTFGFHLWCLITPAAGVVCGNATESSGISYHYSFSDGPPSPNPSWQTWVAPDEHEAVQYKLGGLVHLLVVA